MRDDTSQHSHRLAATQPVQPIATTTWSPRIAAQIPTLLTKLGIRDRMLSKSDEINLELLIRVASQYALSFRWSGSEYDDIVLSVVQVGINIAGGKP